MTQEERDKILAIANELEDCSVNADWGTEKVCADGAGAIFRLIRLLDDTLESTNFHQVLTFNKPMLVAEKGGKIEWSVIDDKDFWVRDD